MESSTRRYLIEFGTSMATYPVLLGVAIYVANHLPASTRPLATLIVVPAIAALVVSVIRYWFASDEFVHRQQHESLAIAFTISVPLLLTIGIAQVFGFMALNFLWAGAILLGAWLIAALITWWRYQR